MVFGQKLVPDMTYNLCSERYVLGICFALSFLGLLSRCGNQHSVRHTWQKPRGLRDFYMKANRDIWNFLYFFPLLFSLPSTVIVFCPCSVYWVLKKGWPYLVLMKQQITFYWSVLFHCWSLNKNEPQLIKLWQIKHEYLTLWIKHYFWCMPLYFPLRFAGFWYWSWLIHHLCATLNPSFACFW